MSAVSTASASSVIEVPFFVSFTKDTKFVNFTTGKAVGDCRTRSHDGFLYTYTTEPFCPQNEEKVMRKPKDTWVGIVLLLIDTNIFPNILKGGDDPKTGLIDKPFQHLFTHLTQTSKI